MLGEKQKVVPGPGTIVGANVKLTGTLKDVNDITVHGRVDGEVISEKNVQIGETATIKGPVTADVITVAGLVKGAVVAKSKLEILPSGQVSGSIDAKELIIRGGAKFNGKCAMPEDAASPETEATNLVEGEETPVEGKEEQQQEEASTEQVDFEIE